MPEYLSPPTFQPPSSHLPSNREICLNLPEDLPNHPLLKVCGEGTELTQKVCAGVNKCDLEERGDVDAGTDSMRGLVWSVNKSVGVGVSARECVVRKRMGDGKEKKEGGTELTSRVVHGSLAGSVGERGVEEKEATKAKTAIGEGQDDNDAAETAELHKKKKARKMMDTETILSIFASTDAGV